MSISQVACSVNCLELCVNLFQPFFSFSTAKVAYLSLMIFSAFQGSQCCFLALAALVKLYVEAINSPGVIPNIQNAWETFVDRKCSKAITEAVKKYEEVMESNLKEERPCDDDELRKFHGKALKKGEGYFMTELVGISTRTTKKYLDKLKVGIK